MSGRNRGAFDTWFTAQFGKRPCRLDQDQEMRDRKLDGEIASIILRDTLEYDAKRTAALYAWQAREKGGSKQ